MPPVPIPWPTNAMPGRWLGEGQGDLINAYAAKQGDIVRIRRMPGLKRYFTLVDTSERIPRGQFNLRDVRLLHAWDNQLQAFDGVANTVLTGSLNGFEPVTMAANMRPAGQQIVICSADEGAQIVNLGTGAIEAYPTQASVSMATMETVEYHAGYFFFTKLNGEIWASDLQSIDVPDQSVALAQYMADSLLRVKSTGSMLVALGSMSTEFMVDMGLSPFPLVPQGTLDVGLLGRWCVAGGVQEWEHGLLWVGSDCTVRQLAGMQAPIISHDDVARDIRVYLDTPEVLRAQCYTFEQQAIWSISSPTWTWEFNLITKAWHRRDSFQLPHWRVGWACRFQGRWHAQDLYKGALQTIDLETFDEDLERMRFRCESGPIKEFPANFRIPSIDIDMTTGVGRTGRPSPYETDPVVMISWSHNGGANWANPVSRSLGAEGRYSTKVTVNNLGRSTTQGVRIRLDVTDPVLVSLQSGISTRTKGSRPRQVNQ